MGYAGAGADAEGIEGVERGWGGVSFGDACEGENVWVVRGREEQSREQPRFLRTVGMRSGTSSVQHLLSPRALNVLKYAVSEARRRGHPQVQPLHVVSMLLTHAGSRLRQACMLSHPQNAQTAECRALEVCFNVALDHLPQSALPAASQPNVSNALMAALKRAHAHQRRGCPEHQHAPLLAVKVEIDQLIISILDDPSVSRVMKEAGFSSTNVKFNLEDGPASAAAAASSAAAAAAAAVTVVSGGAHVVHEPQHAVDMVPLGESFYDSSCVVQEENEMKSSVKMAVGASSMSSWQQAESSLEGERPEMLLRADPAVSLLSREEDIRNVVKILLESCNRNALLIGETTMGANLVVEDLASRIKTGIVPAQLQNLQFLDPKLSSSSFSGCSSLQIEQKLAKLSKIVEECMPAGAILHVGDLQWLAEPVQLKKGPSNFCPAQRTAAELRNLLARHVKQRLWFVGVVTPHIFARLQALYPSLARDWNLQPVRVTTTLEPPPTTFLQRLSSNLPSVSAQQALNSLPVRTSSPVVTSVEQDARYPGNAGVIQRYQCCAHCLAMFEEDRNQIREDESLSLKLAPNKWLSPDDGGASGSASGAMSETKNPSVVQQVAQLQQKWQKYCRMHHGEPAPVSTRSQLPSPLSRVSGSSHIKPCGLGLDVSSQWPNTHLGSTVVDQPLRTPTRIPMYVHSARDQTASTLQTGKEVAAACTKPPETPDFSSAKDGSSVASAPEDRDDPNGSTGTSTQNASLASIQTNLALGRASAVGANLMASKLKASVPKPLTQQQQPSPLQSLRAGLQPVGASPIASLKASSGKPAWLTQSPLQRRPVAAANTASTQGGVLWNASPLARRQANVTKSPSPPPMPPKAVIVDDNLKGLYKGLMQRVPWQAAAIAVIAATIMRCRGGASGFRGQTAKTDTWLLLLGPDPVAKHAIAKALAELVFGGERSLIHLGLAPGSRAKLEADDGGVRYRARTPHDRLAEAVRLKPNAVILLEDIDQADTVMRSKVLRAMEFGKLLDSNGREVSFSNTIVVMTTSIGSELCEPKAGPGSLSFPEAKLAGLMGRAGIRGKIKDSRSDNVVFEVPNRNVVVVDHGAEPQQNEPSSPPVQGPPSWVQKRKPDSLLNVELRPKDGKRVKSGEGRFLNLDLNLATGDASDGWTGDSDQCPAPCEDDQDAKLQVLVAKVRSALTEKFCTLSDITVGFEAYDFNRLAMEVLNKLGNALEVHGPREVGLEVDQQLLEYLIACVWRIPEGHQAFYAWLDDVFVKSLADGRLCGGASALELIAEPVLGGEDCCLALPRPIVFDSTPAV